MKIKKLILPIIFFIIATLTLTACDFGFDITSNSNSTSTTSVNYGAVDKINSSEMFTERDNDATYNPSSAYLITLADNASSANGSVTVASNTVTITNEGTYLVSGSLSNGQLVVDAPETAKVQIILSGVTINSNTSCALYIKQADKVFLTLADGTTNTFSNNNSFVAIDENTIDGAVFSKEDLTINGNGSLTISKSTGHGIVSKDDLVFTGGTISVTASKTAITGKNSVRISDGTFTLNASTDGIHSENLDDTTLGYIYVSDGEFTVTAGSDGIDSSLKTQIDGGTFNIRSTAKGVKTSGTLLIGGGNLTVNSTDDAIHSNATVQIDGGNLTLTSTDDGIHADDAVVINNGVIKVLDSYEGIEGLTIDINGGDITVTADDDGYNAGGGNDGSGGFGGDNFGSGSSSYLKISGGKTVISCQGDGLDSNGNLYVTGGETFVAGPSNGGNGAIDYGDGGAIAQITGGIVIAVGDSGMAVNFGSTSTQGSILYKCSSGNGTVTLKDSNNATLTSFSPNKQYNSVVVSHPSITASGTYALSANGNYTITMTSLIYGSTGSSGMGGGMQRPR